MRPARQTRYAVAHDLDSWKTDERIAARGFAHRWDSVVADGNGEDFFLELLDQHIRGNTDVLDVGCGHGELALSVARRARSVIGLERHRGCLELAEELRGESGLSNVRFIETQLAAPAASHRGGPLPLADRCVDLVLDRRGPPLSHYVDDLRRVARPGALVIGMHPAGTAPPPSWAASIPRLRDRFQMLGFDEVASWVTGPLISHGIAEYRLWWIDVPEYLFSPESVYHRLAGETPTPWESVAADVEAAYKHNQVDGALILRHIRLVWTARLP
jgi:SAM-dependent methyltransferase